MVNEHVVEIVCDDNVTHGTCAPARTLARRRLTAAMINDVARRFLSNADVQHLKLEEGTMRFPTFCIVGFALLTACDHAQLVSGPIDQLRPRLTLDCTLSSAQCNAIDAGISRLEGSAIGDCQFAGNMARLLFDNTSNGFHPGDSQAYPNLDMYVEMGPGTCSSGECRTSDDVYVNNTSYSTSAMAGLIAHEFEHYQGNDNQAHTMNIANPRQTQCTF